jgi:hypothetical protein
MRIKLTLQQQPSASRHEQHNSHPQHDHQHQRHQNNDLEVNANGRIEEGSDDYEQELDDLFHAPLNVSYQPTYYQRMDMVDKLRAMQQKELKHYLPNHNANPYQRIPPHFTHYRNASIYNHNYRHIHSYSRSQSYNHNYNGGKSKVVDESCRSKICEWCYRIVDFFNINREAVYYAMSYLDRFLLMQHQVQNYIDRRTYKLAATTCLLLSLKIHHPKKVELNKVVKDLSRGQFDHEDVARMELTLLPSLSWRLHPSTAASYVKILMELNPFSSSSSGIREFDADGTRTLAMFFVELSVYDYHFVTQRQSTVALAAIMNAMETLGLIHPHRRMSTAILEFIDVIFGAMDEDFDSLAMSECRNQLHYLYVHTDEFANKRKVQVELAACQLDQRRSVGHPSQDGLTGACYSTDIVDCSDIGSGCAPSSILRPRSSSSIDLRRKHRLRNRCKSVSPKSVSLRSPV